MANYLISIFSDGKNVNSYYSDNLDALVTIKALHKNCEIVIFDLVDFSFLSKKQVDAEIVKSGIRWKNYRDKSRRQLALSRHSTNKETRKKTRKYWNRPVLCVETGQVFSSIRECSDKLGIPYMTITNCIKNRNATRGFHFVNAKNIVDEQE